ncbi:unnamed protein product [Darwinula stevensoni]|uniref:Septin-type G domain-containing protein n=1 Tax=Darwinula stevensoni TaxID=69355 RepID=A0A7R8XCB4_9CRUS|nr:unnamed protein product [Darwinula stevensoni]CAG0892389.1 unnamed protein product [Darwinula stevensoni]
MAIDGPTCYFCSHLTEVASPTESHGDVGVDIRNDLQVYVGGGTCLPLPEAAIEYLQWHYPDAGKTHHSQPSGFISDSDIMGVNYEAKYILEKDDREDINLPRDHAAVVPVFNRAKYISVSRPSLLIANYKVCETLCGHGIFQEALSLRKSEKCKQLEEAAGISGRNDNTRNIFLSYPSGDKVFNVFFQIGNHSSEIDEKNLKINIMQAILQCHDDRAVFSTMCGPFLEQAAIVVAFPAFPFIEREHILRFLKCESCSQKILTKDDLLHPDALKEFLRRNGVWEPPSIIAEATSSSERLFREIFSLYICASSSIEMAYSCLQHFPANDDQMEKIACILTPEQKRLVDEDEKSSWLLPIAGASGTGKTLVVKERAKRIGKQEGAQVLVVNLAGGHLTKNFQHEFERLTNIMVLDGRDEEISQDSDGIFAFLQRRGKGKHVLLDEVPLTLGMKGELDEKALSKHWENMSSLEGIVRSLTIAFRPNDAAYTRYINPHEIKVAGQNMNVLNIVKRNPRHVTDLFLALGEYARKVFICEEPTLRDLHFGHPEEELLPTFFPIPSCFTIHDACKSKLVCEAVRSSQAIQTILSKYSITSDSPLYIVVDTIDRRNCLMNTLDLMYRTEVSFIDSGGRYRGSSSSSIIIVTGDQILGYHMNNTILILDLPDYKWKNYVRLISSCQNNVIIIVEHEALHIGKYSQMKPLRTENAMEEIMSDNGKEYEKELQEKMERAEEMGGEGKMARLDEPAWRQMIPAFQVNANLHGTSEEYSYPVENPPLLTVIFGPPSSGKSTLLLERIKHIARRRNEGEKHQGILLHMGSALSQEAARAYLEDYSSALDLKRTEPLSPQDIINYDGVEKARWQYRSSIIHIYVDDYSIQANDTEEEVNKWMQALKDLTEQQEQDLILTVVFKPHSKSGRKISVDELISFFQSQEKVEVITVPKRSLARYSSPSLLANISKNETSNPLRFQTKSLCTASHSGVFVHGPQPKHIKVKYNCPGHHLTRKCKGQEHCGPFMGAFLCFRYVLTFENDKSIYVMVTDPKLLSCLESLSEDHAKRLTFVAPEDFRGCESNVTVAVNVEDTWILDSISRARTSLYIIDCLPDHEGVWQELREDGFLEIQEVSGDWVIDADTLDSLHSFGDFLCEKIHGEDSTTLLDNMKAAADLFQKGMKGKPDIYKLRKSNIMKNDEMGIAKYDVGARILGNGEERTIILVGQTGAGKTTIINGLANYIYGVEWKDDFRFKLITEMADLHEREKAHSQTKEISAYSFNWQEGMRIPYTLTVIDTPGFGDSEGIHKDEELVFKMLEFFNQCAPFGLESINAVGFVLPCSTPRLTATQKYICHAITQLFGNDAKDKFVLLISFSDAQDPPAISTINEAKISYESFHTFNNSALFANSSDPLQEMLWEIGQKSSEDFLKSLGEMSPISLALTKQVLAERRILKETLENLQDNIPRAISKISELQNQCKILREKHEKVTELVRFEEKQIQISLKRKEKAINCITCQTTCEYPTQMSKLKDIEKSGCMESDEQNVKCKKCQCPSKTHRLQSIRYEMKSFYKQKNPEDGDNVAQQIEAKAVQERSLRNLTEEIQKSQVELFAQIQKAHMSKARLEKIALNPEPLSLEEYINFLINIEKKEGIDGSRSRIEQLEYAKEASKLCRQILEEKGSGETILPDVMSILEKEEIKFETLGMETVEEIEQPSSMVDTIKALFISFFGKISKKIRS